MQHKHSLDNVVEQCRALSEAGYVAAAATLAEIGLDGQPNNGRLWEYLAAGRYAERDFAGAVAALEAAALLKPLSIRAQAMLSDGYERQGFVESALCIARHLASSRDVPVELLPALAAQLCRFGDTYTAWRLCHWSVGRFPEEADAYYALVLVKQAMGQPTEALLPVIRRAMDLDSERTEFRLAVAILEQSIGRDDRAYDVASRIPTAELSGVRCRCRLVRLMQLYASFGDVERAAACRKQIVRLSPRDEEDSE